VFGGSFDPSTVAHVLAVAYILSRFRYGRVDLRIMPVYDHAHGKEMLPFHQRLGLTRVAMEPFGDRVAVSNFESVHKPKNTLEMVQQLKKQRPDQDIMLVVGADCYRDRATWHRWDLLEKEVQFAVLGREGVVIEDDDTPLPITLPAISSTDARNFAAVSDASRLSAIVPAGVFSQIRNGGLYGYDYRKESWETAATREGRDAARSI